MSPFFPLLSLHSEASGDFTPMIRRSGLSWFSYFPTLYIVQDIQFAVGMKLTLPSFAMRLRRPSILTFNAWMEECVALLEKSPILEDRRIIAWLKLQRISDEANTAFGFDDASTSFSLSELRLQAILKIFDRKMQDWKKSIPTEVLTGRCCCNFMRGI